MLALRELLVDRGRGGEAHGADDARRRALARPGVRPLPRGPAAVAGARRTGAGPAPSWTSAPAPAASRSRSRDAGHDVIALDLDAELLAALAERAGGSAVRTGQSDARSLELDERALALVIVPMQTIQLLGGEAGRGELLSGRAPAPARRRDPGGGDRHRRRGVRLRRRRSRARPGGRRARQDAIFVSRAVAVRVGDARDPDRAGQAGARRPTAASRQRCCAEKRT